MDDQVSTFSDVAYHIIQSNLWLLKVAKLNLHHISAIRVSRESSKACYDETKRGKYKFGKYWPYDLGLVHNFQ